MGLYRERVLPRIINVACGVKTAEPLRRPDEQVRHWQRRVEPFHKRVFGGCHLTRPIVELLTNAGFTITDLDVFYEKGAPKFAGADSLGVATSP
jgi:hypothetical protein